MTQIVTANSHGIGEQDYDVGVGSLAGYVQVTRCKFPVQSALTAVSVVYTNTKHLDDPNFNNILIECSIECPDISSGIVPMTFSGSSSKTLTPGQVVETDSTDMLVPAGATLWVRTKITVASTVESYAFNHFTVSGDGEGVVNLPGGTDYMSESGGDIAASTNWAYTAAVVRGVTALPHRAVGMIGDSVIYGIGDSSIYKGFAARALGSLVSTAKAATPGDTTANFLSVNSASRRSLLTGCNAAIINLGINDLRNSVSLATIKTNLQAIATYLNGLGIDRVYLCTVTPNTTSTDSWATTGNQTLALSNETDRVALNTWIRTTPAGFTGYFETADAVESARNSGKWKANYTADGLHPNSTGHAAMAATIDATLFTRLYSTDFDELDLTGMEIGAISLRVERLTADFGSGYSAAASVGSGSGLWGWEIESECLPDDAAYGNEIDGMPRFQYYEEFFRNHTEGSSNRLFAIDFRGKKYLATFDTDEIGGQMQTYDVFGLSGVKLKMQRVAGMAFNSDGSIDETA